MSEKLRPYQTGEKPPICSYYLGAMKLLVDEGKWNVNELDAQVYVIENHGTFLDFDKGAASLSLEVAKLGQAHIPLDPQSISCILIARDIIVPVEGIDHKVGRYVWQFKLEFQTDLGLVSREVGLVKLSSGNHIFGDFLPEAMSGQLICEKTSDFDAEQEGQLNRL